jgi:hypothetical protein
MMARAKLAIEGFAIGVACTLVGLMIGVML